MRVLDLFSGIGGFSLGLERAGMRTVAFCECDAYARAVLAKRWPDVPCYDDVRALTAERLAADGIAVDVICGGFPCQDISVAGKGAGLVGERSGLWREYARLIGELRPRYVIVENVAALLGRGLGAVLGDLAALRYDAEWHCIPASHMGAPHRRDRVWVVAYPECCRSSDEPKRDVRSLVCQGGEKETAGHKPAIRAAACSAVVADTNSAQRKGNERSFRVSAEYPDIGGGGWWASEPDVGRVAYGIPSRVDRLKCLGNAVVPQIPELIGRAIMSLESP